MSPFELYRIQNVLKSINLEINRDNRSIANSLVDSECRPNNGWTLHIKFSVHLTLCVPEYPTYTTQSLIPSRPLLPLQLH